MINEQYARAKQILTEHADGHAQLAQLLVDREVIFAEDVERIFGKRPWTSRARAEAEKMAEERTKQLEAQQQEAKQLEAKDTEESKDTEGNEA